MPVSVYYGKVARKQLFLQLMTFVLVSAVFSLKSLEWSVSALAGGVAAWLPNIVFMLFAARSQINSPASGKIAWSFAIAGGLKVVITIILLIVALGVFKVVFVPLGLTYLTVLIVQILAPAVINSYRT